MITPLSEVPHRTDPFKKSLTISRKAQQHILFSSIFFGFLLSVIAVIQYYYVKSELTSMVSSQLSNWADDVCRAVDYRDHWDLKGYLQSALNAGVGYYIISEDGQIVDISGYDPFFPLGATIPLSLREKLSKGDTVSYESTLGENWVLARQNLIKGSIILGIRGAEEISDKFKMLQDARLKLSSISAMQIAKDKGRGINDNIDFAVFDDRDQLIYEFGGIPLEVTQDQQIGFQRAALTPAVYSSMNYLVLTKPIIDKNGKDVGVIVMPQNVEPQYAVLGRQTGFNIAVTGLAWLVVIGLVGWFFISDEIARRQQEISLEEALKKGEGQTVEFKAGVPDELLAQVIAAFANSEGGNIFLGVDDIGNVVGLQEKTSKQRDILLQKLRSHLDEAISPRPLIRPTFLEFGGKTVLRIFVPRGTRPIYLVRGVAYIRQINAVVRARAEDMEERFKHWKY